MVNFTKEHETIMRAVGEVLRGEVSRLEAKIDAADGAGKLLRAVESMRCAESLREIRAWVRGVAFNKSATVAETGPLPAHLEGIE